MRVEVVPAGWLKVHVRSRNPIVWSHAEVDLHADGRVTRPPDDDGFRPFGAPHTAVGTATTVDEAVELVVAQAEKTTAGMEKLVADQLACNLPAEQPVVDDGDLAVACEMR